MLPALWPGLGLDTDARVLVPLCGKSRDMTWLAARGHRVTGIELSAQAARDFFVESRLTPTVHLENGFECHRAGNIEIRVGDLFDLDDTSIAGFDAIYDRAALIALPPAMRVAYIEHIIPSLAAGSSGLLITLDYAQHVMDGPPFAVGEAEVERLIGPYAEIERLAERDALGGKDDHLRTRGLTEARERAYRITRR